MSDNVSTDSERAAQISIMLTQEGRLELAEAVLRLAIQAYRVEAGQSRTVDVPFAGHTRPEKPVRLIRPATPEEATPTNITFERSASGVPTISAASVTAVMAAPAVADRRCVAKVLQENRYVDCHGAIYWVPGVVGDANFPARQARWDHVDDELNADHNAVSLVE